MKITLQMACLGITLAALTLTAIAQNAPATATTINQREENQQDRIAQGIKSGQLTAGETANLETKEAAINNEVRADRHANDGKLTQAERAQVNHQLNHTSRQIYRDKHNGIHQGH
jgi:hypothetical protein